jgi:hypothetical protein
VPLVGLWTLAVVLASEPDLPSIRVHRDAASRQCPDAVELAAKTRDRVGRVALVAGDTSSALVQLEVEFSKTGPAFVAVLTAKGRVNGVRTIEDSSPSCGPLADAVALALTLLVGEAQASLPPPSDKTPDKSPEAPTPEVSLAANTPRAAEPPAGPASPPPAVAVAPTPAPIPRVSGEEPALPRTVGPIAQPGGIAVAAGVGLGGASGIVSRASVLPVLSLAVLPPESPWSLEAEGLWIPPTVLPFTSDIGGGVRVSFAGARVLGCFGLVGDRSSARVSACAGGTGGRIQADGDRLKFEHSVGRAWFAGSIGAVARGPLASNLGWFARVGAEIAINSEAFSLDLMPAVTAYDPPRVAIGASIGLAWTIE